MDPRVSINLCCYNSERFLGETLKSIEEQTFKDWELVVVNDGSTDSTEQIIMEFKARGFPVVYHYQENKGLGYSRNRALELSKGDYITLIDHDDMWLPDKLKRQVEIFEKRDDIDLIYTNYYRLLGSSRTRALNGPQPEGHAFDRFFRDYPVGVLTVAFRKSALQGLEEFFDLNLRLSEEYDLFLRILYRSKAAYIDEPLAVYRIHPDMGTIKFIDRWPGEMEYIIEKYKRIFGDFEAKYKSVLRYMDGKISYYRARAEMASGNPARARGCLKPHIAVDIRFFLLYLVTFLPISVWRTIHLYKDKGML